MIPRRLFDCQWSSAALAEDFDRCTDISGQWSARVDTPVEYAGIIFNGSFIPAFPNASRFFFSPHPAPEPPSPAENSPRSRSVRWFIVRGKSRAYISYVCIYIYVYVYNNIIAGPQRWKNFRAKSTDNICMYVYICVYIYTYISARWSITKIIPHVTHCPSIILFPSNRWSLFCHCFSIVGRTNRDTWWRPVKNRRRNELSDNTAGE